MKKLLLAALFAPLISLAATLHDDGSITLSKDEKEATEKFFNQMLQERQLLLMERGGAMEAIKEMQKKIESFERARCV